MSNPSKASTEQKLLDPMNGIAVLITDILLYIASIAGFVLSIIGLADSEGTSIAHVVLLAVTSLFMCVVLPICFCGLKMVNPNEAAVYVLFGKYYGTIAKPGFFWINPFCFMVNPTARSPLSAAIGTGVVAITQQAQAQTAASAPTASTSKKVSLKAVTLDNNRQKINDSDGNPIDIGVIVIWKVVNPTKAVFEVDDYKQYVSTQADAAIRQVARQYPYDISEHGDERSLRGSSAEIANELKRELQSRVEFAGIEIMDARIAHLAYAPEIAAIMLQRQQAEATIAARRRIVEGAVGMVEMALARLSDNNVVTLDDERKATMVSNLLVVLCGNKEAQPVVNSGSLY
jgi:regulator of protease activity HflC (stomatin/prohibitin superfamily)